MPSVLKNFAIWLMIFLAGFFVYSVSQGRILAAKKPSESLRWAPNYSLGLLKQNERVLGKGLTLEDAQDVKARSEKALKRAPLSHLPFVQLGEADTFINQEAVNKEMYLETKRRDGRNRRALRALVYIYLNEQNYKEAMRNLDTLLKLRGESKHIKVYQDVLTIISTDPATRNIIDTYLVEGPIWGHDYLKHQIAGMTPETTQTIKNSLNIYTNSIDEENMNNELHSSYMNNLLHIKKIDEAYQYWRSLSPELSTQGDYTVYNPNFNQRAELPPFNWSEMDEPKFFSEVDPSGGFYATFADSSVNVLTEQLLNLTPGSAYELEVDAEWSYRQRQGMFFWTVTCLPSNRTISGVNLDDGAKSNSGGSNVFQVPPHQCDHQSLRLIGKPGQYSQRIWSRTNSVNLKLVQ